MHGRRGRTINALLTAPIGVIGNWLLTKKGERSKQTTISSSFWREKDDTNIEGGADFKLWVFIYLAESPNIF